MKNVKLLLCAVTAILCVSCASSRFAAPDVKPAEIQEMLKFEPFSYILVIKKGNKGTYSDSVSNDAKITLNESLEALRENLPLSIEEAKTTDSLERKALEEEIMSLSWSIENNRSIKDISIPPLMDSLLAASGKRFGLIIAQKGFTRVKGNYGGQIAKGIGIGILTLGSFYTVPIKASSAIYAIIVDRKGKSVIFYKRSFMQDKEPTDKEVIEKQLNNLFEKYFWAR